MTLVVIRGLADCPPKFSEIIVYLLLVRFQLEGRTSSCFSSPYAEYTGHCLLFVAMYEGSAGIVSDSQSPVRMYVADKDFS